MKRLLLPLLAAISFSIPVFANWERYLGTKNKVYVEDYVVPKGFNWDWVTDDMVDALPVIFVILLLLLLILVAVLFTFIDKAEEDEERRIKQYQKKYKKEKLISYGHDMKGLEEKYREVKIYREED